MNTSKLKIKIKFKFRVNFAMFWFMRICVGDLTGSSEVIFQILGRKKEKKKKSQHWNNNFKKQNKYIFYRGRNVEG